MSKSKKTTKKVKCNAEKYKERIVAEATMIAYEKHTVRSVSAETGVSKSTVHKDCTDRLEELNRNCWGYKGLCRATRKALDINKAECTDRGGEATKQMYANKRKEKATK